MTCLLQLLQSVPTSNLIVQVKTFARHAAANPLKTLSSITHENQSPDALRHLLDIKPSLWALGLHSATQITTLLAPHWSPLTGVSHDPTYEVWEACMLNVSRGVALVSQFGQTSVIQTEYRARGEAVRSIYRGRGISGFGETTDNFIVDSDHQYVSGLTMIAPSLDRMMGVSLLRLCNGSDWRRRVKVCGELFSTATRSERVSPLIETACITTTAPLDTLNSPSLSISQPLPTPFPQPDSTGMPNSGWVSHIATL